MNRSTPLCVLSAFCLCSLVGFGEDKKKEEEPQLPRSVQLILERTEKEVLSNRMAYDAKNMDSFSKAEKELRGELDRLMKSDRPNKLQEAVLVQETLDGLRKNVTEKVDGVAKEGFKKEEGKNVTGGVSEEKEKAKKIIPKDATVYNGHHYKFYGEVIPWVEAKKKCEDMGGHLVCIGSEKENDFVFKLCGGQRTWIGMYWSNVSTKHEWVNGEKVIFTKWRPSQPQMGDIYVGISYMRTDEWEDYNPTPGGWQAFICEWDK